MKMKLKTRKKNEKEKVMVQLGSTQWAMLDPIGAGLLSLHCKEWEVVAAL